LGAIGHLRILVSVMAMGDKFYSVTLPRDNVIDIDGDEDGPYYNLKGKVQEWSKEYNLYLDYSFDDLGDVWFEFDDRGIAAIFLLAFA
jgi:hypothetical protein